MLSPRASTTLMSCGRSSYTVLAGCVRGGSAGQSKCTLWPAVRATSAAQSAGRRTLNISEHCAQMTWEGLVGIIAIALYTYNARIIYAYN